MARIVVDDITGEQYTEEEWAEHDVYELLITRASGEEVFIETVSPRGMVEAISGQWGGQEVIDLLFHPEEHVEEPVEEVLEEPVEEPERVKRRPMTDAELRERERIIRESNHGVITDIKINNAEL